MVLPTYVNVSCNILNLYFKRNPGKYNGRAYFMMPFPSSWDCRIRHSDSLNPFSSGDVDHIRHFCGILESIGNGE